MSYQISLPLLNVMTHWRDAARTLLSAKIPPQDIVWLEEQQDDLFGNKDHLPKITSTIPITVPANFMAIAKPLLHHNDKERFALLYRLLWLLQADRTLIDQSSDPLIRKISIMVKAVRRDCHKMKAFVRFRDCGLANSGNGRRQFLSWFEPDHHIMPLTAGFFARRFADMDWVIATPSACARHNSGMVELLPGMAKPDLPDDTADDLWRTYYAHIFNPARVKIKAMTSEMPKKYWRNLPEAEIISQLLRESEGRVQQMHDAMQNIGDR